MDHSESTGSQRYMVAYVALIAILNRKKKTFITWSLYNVIVIQWYPYLRRRRESEWSQSIPRPTRGRAQPLLSPY
jgi:hypothetical protein